MSRALAPLFAAYLAAALVVSGLAWSETRGQRQLERALARETLCEQWAALARLDDDPEASIALHSALRSSGAGHLDAASRGRLVRTLAPLRAECPDPGKLRDPERTWSVLSSPCVEEGWRSRGCADALAALFVAEPEVRALAGAILLEHPDAWHTGPFADALVARLARGDVRRTAGMVRGDEGSAAFEARLGSARIRQLARMWAAQHWPESLHRWAQGGRGAWHDALGVALAELSGAGRDGASSLLPRVRDVSGRSVGALLSELPRGRCRVVSAPGAPQARTRVVPCDALVLESPEWLALPATSGGHVLFDLVRARFRAGDAASLTVPFFSFARTGELEPRVRRPSAQHAASAESPSAQVRLDVEDRVAASGPSLRRPNVRAVSVQIARAFPELSDAVDPYPGSRVVSAEEWQSPWLSWTVRVAALSPAGIAFERDRATGAALVVGGVDYASTLDEPSVCPLRPLWEKRTATVLGRFVVPGPEGYYLTVGTFVDAKGDCFSESRREGHFAVVCREDGCSREDLVTSESRS